MSKLPLEARSDVADAYRRQNGNFPGFHFPSVPAGKMARAVTAVEDEYETSRSKAKQALRPALRAFRRVLEEEAGK